MKNRIPCFILLATVSILFSATSFAQDVEQPLGFSTLTLEVDTAKAEFVQMEPIPIFLKLSNNTGQPVRGHLQLGFSHSPIELFAIYNGKPQNIEALSLRRNCGELSTRIIKPGEYNYTKELLKNKLDTVFSRPGIYQIHAVLEDTDGKEKVKSNLLTIRILPPRALDLQALEYIQNIKTIRDKGFFFSGYGFEDDVEKERVLEEFVSRYRKSAYGDYAALILGEFYLYKELHELAIEQFDSLAFNNDFAFADQALSYLVETNVKLGNGEKAKQCFETLRSKYPSSEYIKKAEKYFSRED